MTSVLPKIISVDDHLVEPPDLEPLVVNWDEVQAERFREIVFADRFEHQSVVPLRRKDVSH